MTKERKSKLLWMGAVLEAFTKEPESKKTIGYKKAILLEWIWTNRANLKSSTRAIAFQAGLTEDKNVQNVTMTNTLAVLTKNKLLEKSAKGDKLIVLIP